MVMVLIAVNGQRPLWVSLLVYATVLVTVLSGADYFFGVLTASRRARLGGSCEPLTAVPVWQLPTDLPERPEALGDDVVLVDRLEVDLAGRDERAVVEGREARTRPR